MISFLDRGFYGNFLVGCRCGGSEYWMGSSEVLGEVLLVFVD